MVHRKRLGVRVADQAGRSLRSRGGFRYVDDAVTLYRYLADIRLVDDGVESGGILPVVRDPERARAAVRHAPGVAELRIGYPCQVVDVRNQIGLNKFGLIGPRRTGI